MSLSYFNISHDGAFLETGIIPVEYFNTITAPYTVLDSDRYILNNAVNNTIDMELTPPEGRKVIIKNIINTRLTLDGNGNNIDGDSTFVLLPARGSITVIYIGGEWVIL